MTTLRQQLQLGDDPRKATLLRAWRSALKALAGKVNRPTYEGYIRQVEPKSWEEGVVTLAVPSPFAREWLRGRYAEVIREALEAALANRIALQFVVEPPPLPPATEGALRRQAQNGSHLYVVQAGGAQPETAARSPRLDRTEPGAPDWLAPLHLVERFTFERFITGAGSRVLFAASMAVADAPGARYNPLVLVGPSGVGKTHLLHAIAHRARAANPEIRIGYLDAESFTYRYLSGSKHKDRPFKDFCDGVDICLVDDIQFIASREPAREEFYHTITELARTERQMVVTSDRTPRELPLDERIRTRLEGGLLLEIAPPELDTRMAVVDRLARESGAALPGEIVYYIANGIRTNVRSLEGAVTKLLAYCETMHAPFSLDVATEVLASNMSDLPMRGWMRKGVAMEAILAAVSEQFGVTIESLRGPQLDHRTVRARQVAMYLCRQFTEQGFTRIGQALGGRDHATIKRGIARIQALIEKDPGLRADVVRAQERFAQ
jgi:chromosomal replication initiator protein